MKFRDIQHNNSTKKKQTPENTSSKKTSVHDQATSIIHLHCFLNKPLTLQALQVIPPIKLRREESRDKIHVTN
jgi:hypothetical protein